MVIYRNLFKVVLYPNSLEIKGIYHLISKRIQFRDDISLTIRIVNLIGVSAVSIFLIVQYFPSQERIVVPRGFDRLYQFLSMQYGEYLLVCWGSARCICFLRVGNFTQMCANCLPNGLCLCRELCGVNLRQSAACRVKSDLPLIVRLFPLGVEDQVVSGHGFRAVRNHFPSGRVQSPAFEYHIGRESGGSFNLIVSLAILF